MKRKQTLEHALSMLTITPKKYYAWQIEQQSSPEFYYSVARVVQLELLMSCELLFTTKMFILTFPLRCRNAARLVSYVLATTLRIFFLIVPARYK